jgi:hypothetical protein
MPLKVNVGISKKLGLPDYGSLGASCNVEVDLDGFSLPVASDQTAFQDQVRRAFAACAQAVNDELARQRQHENAPITAGASSTPSPVAPARNGNSNDQRDSGPRGSQSSGTNGTRASTKQMDYLRHLASQVDGLGTRRLDSLAQKLCGKPLAELSTLNASSLIDTIKAVKEGRLSLDSLNSESLS